MTNPNAAPGGDPRPETGPPTGPLDAIRHMYRTGVIKASGGDPRPQVVRDNPGRHQALLGAVEGWRQQLASDDPVADEVAQRITSSLIRISAARSDPTVLDNVALVRDSLNALHADALYAHTELGIKKNIASSALFNTREELQQAKEIAEKSPHLMPSDFTYCVDNSKQNVLRAVRQADAGARAVAQAIESGKIAKENAPGKKIISKLAIRAESPEVAVEKVSAYAEQVSELTKKYDGHPVVTPGRIRSIAGSHENPTAAIKEKIRETHKLTTEYKGEAGLTESEIATAVFDTADPRAKIRDTLRGIPNVREALGPDRVSENVARELLLRHADPVGAGRKLLAQADNLKGQLAGNAEAQATLTNDDYLSFSQQKDGAQAAATFAHNLTVARRHFSNNNQATEAILRKASQQDGNVIQNANDLVGKVGQLHSRHIQNDVPRSVIERAVTASADPDKEINDFIANRSEIRRQFGETPPQHAVNRICRESRQPVEEVGRRMKLLHDALQAPENAGRPQEDIAREIFAKPNKDLPAVEKPYTATALFKDMQAASREERRGGSNAHADHNLIPYRDAAAQKAQAWLEEHPLRSGDQREAALRFGRLVYMYVKQHGPGLLGDDTMVDAILQDYLAYVELLASQGFGWPEAVAQFTDEEALNSEINGPLGIARLIKASKDRRTDPIGRAQELYEKEMRDNALAESPEEQQKRDEIQEAVDRTLGQTAQSRVVIDQDILASLARIQDPALPTERRAQMAIRKQKQRDAEKHAERPASSSGGSRASAIGEVSVGGIIAQINAAQEMLTEATGMALVGRERLEESLGALAAALESAGADAATVAGGALQQAIDILDDFQGSVTQGNESLDTYKGGL